MSSLPEDPTPYIVSAARTPIGAFGGAFRDVPAPQLGAAAIRGALERAGVVAEAVEEVLMGNILQAGLGQNPARQAALGADIPQNVPATTINCVCASGLSAVADAARRIQLGERHLLVAGGMESMSGVPYALPKARWGYRLGGGLHDLLLHDGLLDAYCGCHMGELAELLAQKYQISREAQDAFAAQSQARYAAAKAACKVKEEIVPVGVPQPRGEPVIVEEDEHPRPDATADSLGRLRPAFKADGTITPGNASGLNDGAAALVVASEAWAREHKAQPLARIVAHELVAGDPNYFGVVPAQAVRRLLDKTALSLNEIDLIESNEAFAVQALALGKELGWNWDKVNVNGGAIALGHPIGASGARILVTLLYEMARRSARYGLATLCVGGGQGAAMLVERA